MNEVRLPEIQESEKKWVYQTLAKANHYTPVVWRDKILRDGIRRKEENQHIRLKHLDVKGKTVVDLGCNNGYFCIRLRQKGATKIFGIDNSDGIIKLASIITRYNQITNVRYYISDINIVDPRPIHSDVALILSLHPVNWEFEKLVAGGDKAIKSFNFLKRFADIIHLEPTNHHKQSQKDWIADIKVAAKHVAKLGGSLEFLTWTDYQNRPLMKFIPVKK